MIEENTSDRIKIFFVSFDFYRAKSDGWKVIYSLCSSLLPLFNDNRISHTRTFCSPKLYHWFSK